jgi:hypothetical protein
MGSPATAESAVLSVPDVPLGFRFDVPSKIN